MGGRGAPTLGGSYSGGHEISSTHLNMAPKSFLGECSAWLLCCSFLASSASFPSPGLPPVVPRICHCCHSLLSSNPSLDPETSPETLAPLLSPRVQWLERKGGGPEAVVLLACSSPLVQWSWRGWRQCISNRAYKGRVRE